MGNFRECFIFAKLRIGEVSRKLNPCERVKSLCRLAIVANFNVANMSFNAILENKILAKISGFTVCDITIVVVDRI